MLPRAALMFAVAAGLVALALPAGRYTRWPLTTRTTLGYLALVHLVLAFGLVTSPLLAGSIGALLLLLFPSMLLPAVFMELAPLSTAAGLSADYLLLLWTALTNACLLAVLVYLFEQPGRRARQLGR